MISAQLPSPPPSQSASSGWSWLTSKPVYHPHWTPTNSPTTSRWYKSTEEAISTALHSALSYLDNGNTYMRILFINFSSAFITPCKLIIELSDLGINTSFSNWILDRPQSVRLDHSTSPTLILNTGTGTWLKHHCQVRRRHSKNNE